VRRYLPVFLAGLVAGLAAAVALRPADAGPEPPGLLETARERDRLQDEAAQLRRDLDGTRRRLASSSYWWELWRRAALRAGTPESWGGPVVNTIYLVPREELLPEPDLIPPPPVPVPTRPSGEKE
jgi:hypothetical protein